MVDAIATPHIAHTKPMQKAIASGPLASAGIKHETDARRDSCIYFRPITSKKWPMQQSQNLVVYIEVLEPEVFSEPPKVDTSDTTPA